jgi:phage terminase large subunit
MIVLPYAPRRVFVPYHMRSQRWTAMAAHRRAGKTVACINDLIAKALTCRRQDPPPLYAYVAPYLAQAKEIAWGYLVRGSAPARKNKHEGDLWVELINGARIRLMALTTRTGCAAPTSTAWSSTSSPTCGRASGAR